MGLLLTILCNPILRQVPIVTVLINQILLVTQAHQWSLILLLDDLVRWQTAVAILGVLIFRCMVVVFPVNQWLIKEVEILIVYGIWGG